MSTISHIVLHRNFRPTERKRERKRERQRKGERERQIGEGQREREKEREAFKALALLAQTVISILTETVPGVLS